MDLEEAALKFIVKQVEKHCAAEVALLGGLVAAPENVPFLD